MPLPDPTLLKKLGNRLSNEELSYDRVQLKQLHEQSLLYLNPSQKLDYDTIVSSIENDSEDLYFVSGYGGIGKTFLWKTIMASLRSKSKIVLTVATAGIAALLIPNGRMAHSRFYIPLNLTEESTYEIRHGTQLAKLLLKISLIIWDEAPIANKFCFEALDKIIMDILSTKNMDNRNKSFGGLTVVCGGDFHQILSVISKGGRADIVDTSLNSSYLWPFFKIYELNQNMGLHNDNLTDSETSKIEDFDKWLLQAGDG